MKKAQEDANRDMVERARLTVVQATRTEDELNAQMAEMRTRLQSLATGATTLARYNELRKEIENLQSWHDNLQQTLMEAKISDNFPVLDIQLLERAKAPKEPAFPNKPQMAVVAVGLSFLLSIGLALFLDYMDRTVRKPEDVEDELRMSLVGFVPTIDHSVPPSERGRIVAKDSTCGASESYRKIRAKLYVYKKESHARLLAITSSTAGEGKTTFASNLALAFAQAGSKVLLVDADMRHPALERIFNVDRSPGLAEFLDGASQWQTSVVSTDLPSLSFLPCGSAGSRSAELLEGAKLRAFFDEARDQYDIVVLDAPPVLGVADSTIICHLADATLFVVQASRNPKWLVRRARLELDAAGARIAGVILNRVKSRRGNYYYYHRYYPAKA